MLTGFTSPQSAFLDAQTTYWKYLLLPVKQICQVSCEGLSVWFAQYVFCCQKTLMPTMGNMRSSKTSTIYRVIRNDCRGFNNLSYIKHLKYEYMYFLFNRTTLQVFVTYLTAALYVHLL